MGAGLRLLLLIFAVLLSVSPLNAQRQLYGRAYYSLPEVAGWLGMQNAWAQYERVTELSSKWTKARFELHKRYFLLNGRRIYVGSPIALNAGKLHIGAEDYERTIRAILTPQVFEPKPKLYRIVLDPGHGGKDSGALNGRIGVNEKESTLDVALRLKPRLEARVYKVYLTRDSDRYVSLASRPALANKVNADLFVSIHFNSVSVRSVTGVETYVMTLQGHASTNVNKVTSGARRAYDGNKNDPWNALAGYHLQAAMLKELGAQDRGLRRARFYVLREVECPAALVECGFLSNDAEGRQIQSAAYREKIAASLERGIANYQNTLNRIRGR